VKACCSRDHLAPDRVVWVVRVDERDEVRGDVDPELVLGREAFPLVVGQVEDLLDLFQIVDPMAQLPAPVVPLLVRDVLPDRGAPTDRGSTVRAEHLRRVAPVDERRLRARSPRFGGLMGDGVLDLVGVQLERPPGARRAAEATANA
jgi:hypothetical protein